MFGRVSSGEAHGFVVLRGGRETRQDCFPPEALGFCHQRTTINISELGAFTQCQAHEKCGGDIRQVEAFLAAQSNVSPYIRRLTIYYYITTYIDPSFILLYQESTHESHPGSHLDINKSTQEIILFLLISIFAHAILLKIH
jgi:hypothetical protein